MKKHILLLALIFSVLARGILAEDEERRRPSPRPSACPACPVCPQPSPSPSPKPTPSPSPSPSPTGIPSGRYTLSCAARWGEYCTDPFNDSGKKLASIFPDRVPVYCDVLRDGKVVTDVSPELTVVQTGEKLPMTLNALGILEAKPLLANPGDYQVVAKIGNVTASATVYREMAKCKDCHSAGLPGAHAGRELTNCKSCHAAQEKGGNQTMDFGVKMHMHALNKAKLPGTGSATCYQCHPKGCLDTDHHKVEEKMDCTSCHGNLSQVAQNTFKISGVAGKPKCENCHTDNGHWKVGTLMADSRRADSKRACVSCHGSPHRLVKPD